MLSADCPASDFSKRLGIKSSDDAVLRRVKTRGREASQPAVRVLSVDDWAWRKKQRYGTMLLGLERSQVIDLLPVRSADSFAHWLGLHPEVEMITRDRSSLYADGGRQGAPSAVQITDRYHLVSNLSEAVERDIQQLQIDARKQLAQSETREPGKTNRVTFDRSAAPEMPARSDSTTNRGEDRHRRRHLARWLNAPPFPERRIRSDRRRDQKLFLQRRERGLQPSLTRTHYSAGCMSALLNMPPQTLSATQKRHWDAFLRAFAQFASTLRRDLEAVKLSITKPWSNGPIEGHINRLKAIKRQMYGRAGFELLKARVLPWETSNAA